MQTNTTRDKTIDFIKGILILFVILGHTTLGLTDMYSFDDTMNGIANVIYSFHMPCFIAVSGFLYSEYVGDASQGIFSRIGHKAFNILLPYVMISVIYWIIKFALSNLIREPVAVSSLISIPWKPIEFLWYLYALFLIYCVAYMADYVFARLLPHFNYKMELLFVLFLIIALTCYGSFHYVGFNYIAGFQMYFYLGCLIKKWLDKLDNRYAVLSLAVMSVLVESSGIVLQDDMSSNPLCSSLFERFTACIVTVFIFAVSYFLSGYCDFPKWLQTIGRDSMPFYAMNVIFVGGIRIILNRAGITNMVLQCICGFAGSTAICWILYECIIKKIRLIDFIFYPGKQLHIRK